MICEKNILANPLLGDPDLSISTMAYFRMKVAELERRVKGSGGWKKTANEIQHVLLRQIAYRCTPEQLSQCALELSVETHVTLLELIEPGLSCHESQLRADLDIIATGNNDVPLLGLMELLEQCWWPRFLSTFFFGWESVLSREDLTEGRARDLVEPLISNPNSRTKQFIQHEMSVLATTRLAIPPGMWWYDYFVALHGSDDINRDPWRGVIEINRIWY